MKRVFFSFAAILFFIACNPNAHESFPERDSTHTVIDSNSGNAGLTGSTDANGFITADSNKTILKQSNAATANADSTMKKDSAK